MIDGLTDGSTTTTLAATRSTAYDEIQNSSEISRMQPACAGLERLRHQCLLGADAEHEDMAMLLCFSRMRRRRHGSPLVPGRRDR